VASFEVADALKVEQIGPMSAEGVQAALKEKPFMEALFG
jgi:hypothetical protein